MNQNPLWKKILSTFDDYATFLGSIVMVVVVVKFLNAFFNAMVGLVKMVFYFNDK